MNLIYESCVEAEEDLIARILATWEVIESRPRIFKSVRQNRGGVASKSSCELIGINVIDNITQNIKQNKHL